MIGTRIIQLPAPVQALETALHAVCDRGRWQDSVQVVFDPRSKHYVLTLMPPKGPRNEGRGDRKPPEPGCGRMQVRGDVHGQ